MPLPLVPLLVLVLLALWMLLLPLSLWRRYCLGQVGSAAQAAAGCSSENR